MGRVMPHFSLTQLLMTVALVAIVFTLARSEGCGTRESLVVHLEFASDGKHLLVARFDDHDAGVPHKHYSDEDLPDHLHRRQPDGSRDAGC